MPRREPRNLAATQRPPGVSKLLADDVVRGAILLRLLEEYQAPITLDELLREMTGPRRKFAEDDQLCRAVRDLERTGLVRRHEDLVSPTRAAVHFSRLACEW